ncbi:MAG: AmmeMemoRadiSam system protein B [Gammaproteobacteria bacterium]|nr:AmmeMemoRadiSam system protein B [Gammaproteobacteria bacterium]
MSTVRPAAVAGMFYDDNPDRLRRDVTGFLCGAAGAELHRRTAPKAIIAPHAGYPYSGAVAGRAYATVKPLGRRIKRVVLLGPAHRLYVRGIAASTAGAFATPLGEVPVDQATIRDLAGELGFLVYSDEAHAMEHSLEVHLPFLQAIFEEISLLPFVVGDAAPSQVEVLLDRLWGGDETLIIVSSDLSHYRSYEAAREIDAFSTEQIRLLAPEKLTGEHACGYLPIGGLLRAAARRHLSCEVLDTCSSGDTAGPRVRVVGYGAYVFYGA